MREIGVMRKISVLCTALALAGTMSACTVIRELPPEERAGMPQNEESELCRALLTAFLDNDAETFLARLPEETRRNFTKQHFQTTRGSVVESMGEPISFQYVTDLELTAFTPHIWKIRFQRTDARTQEVFTSEALFRIITGRVDGKPVVIAFQFL